MQSYETAGCRRPTGRRQLIAYALSAVVMAAVAYAFAPRAPSALEPTELHPDRVHINDMLINGERLLAVGERGTILFSLDQGRSWQQATLATQRQATLTGVAALNENVLLAVGHDGWKLRSADGGATWHEVAFDGELGEPLLDVWSANGQDVFALGSFGKFYESADSGHTWSAREMTADGWHLNGMGGDRNGQQMLVGEQGLVLRSEDGGRNWETLAPFYNGSLFGVARLSDELWVTYGMRGRVFLSADFGESWTQVELGHSHALYGHVLLPNGAGVMLVGADGSMVHLSAEGQLLESIQGSGLGTLTSAVAVNERLLVGGERGVFQGIGAQRLTASANRSMP